MTFVSADLSENIDRIISYQKRKKNRKKQNFHVITYKILTFLPQSEYEKIFLPKIVMNKKKNHPLDDSPYFRFYNVLYDYLNIIILLTGLNV